MIPLAWYMIQSIYGRLLHFSKQIIQKNKDIKIGKPHGIKGYSNKEHVFFTIKNNQPSRQHQLPHIWNEELLRMTLLFICETQLGKHLVPTKSKSVYDHQIQSIHHKLAGLLNELAFYLQSVNPPRSAINNNHLQYFLHRPFPVHLLGIHATVEEVQNLEIISQIIMLSRQHELTVYSEQKGCPTFREPLFKNIGTANAQMNKHTINMLSSSSLNRG